MSESHDHLWSQLARHRPHHSMRYEVMHVGFYSTIVLLVFMMLVVFIPQMFAIEVFGQTLAFWICIAYLVCQLSEFVARDPLDWSEAAEGHLFAAIPAIGGLVLKIESWLTLKGILSPLGQHILTMWLWISWICLIFGFIFAIRAVTAPYRRDEVEQRGDVH